MGLNRDPEMLTYRRNSAGPGSAESLGAVRGPDGLRREFPAAGLWIGMPAPGPAELAWDRGPEQPARG